MSKPARRRTSVAFEVYEALKQDIATGFYGGGEELLELEIAVRFGVSRTPVREALIRLECNGLVRMTHHRTAVISRVTPRDILDVLQLRAAIEGFAIEYHGADIDRSILEALRDGYESPVSEPVTPREILLYTSDTSLHRAIVDALGNSRIVDFIHIQDVRLAQLRARVWRVNEANVDALMERRAVESGSEHVEIIDALLAGDYPSAQRALIHHFTGARDHLLQVLAVLEALPTTKVSNPK
jgi:DNA-binding GntR family transcriptional regulator